MMLKKCGGYFTVEATFIVTVCIVIIMGVMYTGSYVHDRLVLESVTTRALSAGVHALDDGKEDGKELETGIINELESRLFLMRIEHVDISQGLMEINADITFALPLSLGFLKRAWMGEDDAAAESIAVSSVMPSKLKWDADGIKKK